MTKILLVSHDAGGAEVLSSWLLKQNYVYYIYAKGPAKKIFLKKNFQISSQPINDLIDMVDFIITSTSWQSDIERETIYFAKKRSKYTVSMLDHWSNYKERFNYKGKIILPDEIWTLDKYAFKIAKKFFNKSKVKLKENYYLKNIVSLLRYKTKK